jgi:cystathionine beta-synthase
MNNIFETTKIKELLPKIKQFVKEHLYELETPENLNGLFSKIEPLLLEKRELVKTEGLFVGYTSGAVMQAIKQYANEGEFTPESVVVGIFPDHGSRYMSKVFSDDWMNEQGFFDSINAEESQKVEFIK